jgi:hypothetical protein
MARRQTKKAAKSKKAPPPEAPAKPKPKKPALPEATVVSNGTNVEAVVVSNGSNAGMLGRPVFLEPNNPHAVTTNFVSRSDLDPQEPLEPLSPTVVGLKGLVDAMSTNKDIAPFKSHIQQIAANQPEKGDVVRAYVNQANHELLADMIEMRANAVRHIKRATRRNDVSVSEALVVWRMSNDQIPELTKGLTDNDRAVDTVTVIEKIDFHRQQTERTVQKRWEGTTPQGRELIRKKLWELEQKLNAERGILPKGVEPPEVPEDTSAEETDEPAEATTKPA